MKRRYCGQCSSECLTCRKSFPCTGDRKQYYCSTDCQKLKNSKVEVTAELLNHYREPGRWAEEFTQKNKRKPTAIDYRMFFGVTKVNPRAEVFLEKGPSSLEDPVYEFIRDSLSEGVEVLRNKRPLKFEKGRYEIDIYIPNLHLGFEVQDNKTHAHSDDVPLLIKAGDKRFKHGPTYHEFKRELAKAQLNVTIIDLWEDDIRSGDYKEIVTKALQEAHDERNNLFTG